MDRLGGADPAPAYRRMYNLALDQQPFDADGAYVRRWVPEVRDVRASRLTQPWTMTDEEQRAAGCVIGEDYPAPVVDHAAERRRRSSATRPCRGAEPRAAFERGVPPREDGRARGAADGARLATRGGPMLDHMGFGVSDYERSKAFYERALAPLGVTLLMEPAPGVGGFGEGGKPYFWIETRGAAYEGDLHVAFAVDDRATVDAFHAAALEAGGTDNGAPGVRDIYHPDYYGAYVLDPDGNNIEAVCHRPA